MTKDTINSIKTFCPTCLDRIRAKQAQIHRWLHTYEDQNLIPLYSSVDIRDAGFKIAVVDTNLFPAGFNNLCEHGLADAVGLMRQAILKRRQDCHDVLIVVEEHTRNTWYLENIRILEGIIRQAGFNVQSATFFTEQPQFCQGEMAAEFTTATDQKVKIYCFKTILESLKTGKGKVDMIIMNNDLSTGIPEILLQSKIPIYPPMQIGWHSRLKSNHFALANDLMREFAEIVDMDPWLFSCLFKVVHGIDINQEQDRIRLRDTAADLFRQIEQKYKQHRISEKPYIVLKSDSGTYGMGVMAIEDPAEIIDLNRKARNQLHKGKGAVVIDRFILQEGVPTIYQVDEQVSEVVVYQIENNFVGGFYRFNTEKTDRQNLNSKGMGFKKMCPHLKKYGDGTIHPDVNVFDIYRILARVAAIAAYQEIVQLKEKK